MKLKNNNELWLQNSGTNDIRISDLNVKVRAGSVVNVYQFNPYLTVEQVKASRENGSLSRKLDAKLLNVVSGGTNPVPPTLGHVKESKKPLVRKSKTSVVVEQEKNDPEQTETFDFADYGISDLGPVEQVSEGGTVSVRVKQDETQPTKEKETFNEHVGPGPSKQSQEVLEDRISKESSPYGQSATVVSGNQPYTVVSPELVPEVEPDTGMVTVKKAKPVKRSDESGVLEDDEEGADKVIDSEPTEFDTKVATVTEDGSVIMKIKEE